MFHVRPHCFTIAEEFCHNVSLPPPSVAFWLLPRAFLLFFCYSLTTFVCCPSVISYSLLLVLRSYLLARLNHTVEIEGIVTEELGFGLVKGNELEVKR